MKIEISQKQLDAVIVALEFVEATAERDAAALSSAADQLQDDVASEAARRLARLRMEQIKSADDLLDFFLHV